jgi:Epoxide hydrolase N terminus
MTALKSVMYIATPHTTPGRDGASRRARRRLLLSSAVTGAFGLLLLVAPCSAQTVRLADAEISVASQPPTSLRAATDAVGPARSEPPRTLQKETTAQLAPASGAAAEDTTIRPFRVNVPEDALVDLRRRLAATRWPDQETVTDRSQGAQLATMKELVRYWDDARRNDQRDHAATLASSRAGGSNRMAAPDGHVDAHVTHAELRLDSRA